MEPLSRGEGHDSELTDENLDRAILAAVQDGRYDVAEQLAQIKRETREARAGVVRLDVARRRRER